MKNIYQPDDNLNTYVSHGAQVLYLRGITPIANGYDFPI